ncbi:DUF2147 domain-containing protein [Roseibium aestuarii]|uniref:DUF2147 domain-containing protein n=1 Tax=Roseibium aestuarii TaxID=2600299 RepID=A0ABW4JPA8_9HYPH|nr:DUF2147 domain-containing protein [Roseibium aestuarii]
MSVKLLRAAGAALALSALVLGAGSAQAADPTGEWVRPSGSSKIRIAPCGPALCGNLIWVKEARNDVNNPDPAKRGNPLVGLQIVSGMKASGKDSWKGKVYNAEDGKTYTGVMAMPSDDKLKLEGCVLGGLICKGETWKRVK